MLVFYDLAPLLKDDVDPSTFNHCRPDPFSLPLASQRPEAYRSNLISVQVLVPAVSRLAGNKYGYVRRHDDKPSLTEILFLSGFNVGDKQMCKTVSGLRKFILPILSCLTS